MYYCMCSFYLFLQDLLLHFVSLFTCYCLLFLDYYHITYISNMVIYTQTKYTELKTKLILS